jgi:L-arabinonolactonase
MRMQVRNVGVPLCQIGEGPVWDVAGQALFYIDILGQAVHRHEPASGSHRSWPVPDMIGSMALTESGKAIVALTAGVHWLDLDTGAVTPLAVLDLADPSVQLADGKVDRRGRFIFGTSHRQMQVARGGVYSLTKGRIDRLDGDVILVNGPCWSPDDRTFYHADSIRKAIYAYDYDVETGAAGNRRLWATTEELGGIPDGATIDADGCMWMAICEGGKVVQFRPDGKVERIIAMPVKLPASVMFGGPDLDLLYVPTINPGFMGRTAAPDDGSLYVIEGLGAKGLPEPRYAD